MGEYDRVIQYKQLSRWRNLATEKSWKLTFRALALRQSERWRANVSFETGHLNFHLYLLFNWRIIKTTGKLSIFFETSIPSSNGSLLIHPITYLHIHPFHISIEMKLEKFFIMRWYQFQKEHWARLSLKSCFDTASLMYQIYHPFWQNLNKKQTNKNNKPVRLTRRRHKLQFC